MPVFAINKQATFDYEILDKYEAGLVLFGYEVKAVRAGNVNLKGSYITFRTGIKGLPDPYLINAHISLYKYASTIAESKGNKIFNGQKAGAGLDDSALAYLY